MSDVPGVIMPGAAPAIVVTGAVEGPKKKTALYIGIGAAVLAVAVGTFMVFYAIRGGQARIPA